MILCVGGEINRELNQTINSHPNRSPKERAWGDGETKGRDWCEGQGPSPNWALLWAGLSDSPDPWVHEANILGAGLGCDGTYMLLHYLFWVWSCLSFLHEDLHRTYLSGLFPSPIQGEAGASDEETELWHEQVQGAVQGVLSQFWRWCQIGNFFGLPLLL